MHQACPQYAPGYPQNNNALKAGLTRLNQATDNGQKAKRIRRFV